MEIREYQTSDLDAIARVYRDAATNTGSQVYSSTQVEVWAAFADRLKQKLDGGWTIVSVENGEVVAFGQLDPVDRISLLYTTSQYGRKGYATQIYRRLEGRAIASGATHLRTEASRIAKHFFLKMGFEIVETEYVDRDGVEFERFKMRKAIAV